MAGGLNTGKQRDPGQFLCPMAQPNTPSPRPWLEKGHEEETGEQAPQQEQQQLPAPSPINTLHYQATREGWEEGLGWAGRGRSCHLCR